MKSIQHTVWLSERSIFQQMVFITVGSLTRHSLKCPPLGLHEALIFWFSPCFSDPLLACPIMPFSLPFKCRLCPELIIAPFPA